MIKDNISIVLLLFFVIILIGFSSAEEVVCDDYCVDGVSYSHGTYNDRSELCEYGIETICEYGCNISSYTECEDQQFIDCPDYCDDGVSYSDGTYNGESELCEYGIETVCEYGCNITNYVACGDQQFIDCPDVCDDGIFYHSVENPALECNYTEILCDSECDENGCISLSEEHTQEDIPKDNESNDKTSGDEIPNVTVQTPTSTNDQDSDGIVIAEKKEKNSNDFDFNLPNVSANGFFIQYKTPDKDFSFENKVGFIEKKYYSQGNVEDIEIGEEEDEPLYKFTLLNQGKLLGLFNINLKTKVYVNARTLEEKERKTPWWNFFVTGIKNPLPIGNFICTDNSECDQFNDGNLCTGTYICDTTGIIAGISNRCAINSTSVKICNDLEKDCQMNTCNPTTGKCEKVDLPKETLCEADNDDCTKKDHCYMGECIPGNFDYENENCQCAKGTDCKKFENENACDGTLYCNHSTHKCDLNPVTVIKCQNYYDSSCLKNTCNNLTGHCEMTSANDGGSCDADGNYCTNADTCVQGKCILGSENICECEKDSDCNSLENGNVCDGTLYCDLYAHKCVLNPATVINCQSVDDTQCLKNTCNKVTGNCEMKPTNINSTCYTETKCIDATCNEMGECVGEWNFNKVIPGERKCQCQKKSDCEKFENGNVCDGTLYCNILLGSCELNPATVINCQSADDTYCRKNTCNHETGECEMKPVNTGEVCISSHKCINSFCNDQGLCSGSWDFNKILDNGNKCECKENTDCEKFEDGDECNGTLFCDKSDNSCKINPSTIGIC